MRRKGPKENIKENGFIQIKFEKLKLISISPFYQILSGPQNRQDQAHCPVRPGPRYHGTPQNYLGDLGTQEVDIASRKRGGTTTPLRSR